MVYFIYKNNIQIEMVKGTKNKAKDLAIKIANENGNFIGDYSLIYISTYNNKKKLKEIKL